MIAKNRETYVTRIHLQSCCFTHSHTHTNELLRQSTAHESNTRPACSAGGQGHGGDFSWVVRIGTMIVPCIPHACVDPALGAQTDVVIGPLARVQTRALVAEPIASPEDGVVHWVRRAIEAVPGTMQWIAAFLVSNVPPLGPGRKGADHGRHAVS